MDVPISKQSIISIAVLERLIDNLPPAALASLPVESLPDNIPVELVTSAPEVKASILEDLLLEHQRFMLNIRQSIQNNLGIAGINAYELAQQGCSAPHLSSLKANLHEYRAYKRYFSFEQENEGSSRLLHLLEEHHPAIEDIRHDYFELKHAKTSLQSNTSLPDILQNRISQAQRSLEAMLEERSILLAQYFTERLALVISIMVGHSEELETQLGHWNRLKDQALAISKELEESERLLTPKLYRSATTEHPRQHISLSLESLRDKLATVQLPYSEDELTHWMDILVDYHCHMNDSATSSNDVLFEKARKHIHRLLSYHFESELVTSLPISSSEKIHHDAQKLQGFLGKSHDYLENYLKERTQEASQRLHF